MDRKLLHKTEDNLWEILEKYATINSADDVETIKHALSGIFKIKCLEGMDDYLEGSFRGGRSGDGRSNDGRSYMYYDEGRYAPSFGGRSMDGGSYRYSRDNGDMRHKLDELMRSATDERQRQIIRDMMNRV